MGLLTIDNRFATNLPGLPKGMVEMETVSCAHCQGVIAILAHHRQHFSLSSIDVGRAVPKAHQAGDDYVGKHRCSRCDKNVCRRCALEMKQAGGACPGPFMARLETAIKKKRSFAETTYNYR